VPGKSHCKITNGWSNFTANYQKLKNTIYMILIFDFFFDFLIFDFYFLSWVGDENEEEKMG
jgi:hypothetical protein